MRDLRQGLEAIAKRLSLEVEDLFLKFHMGAYFNFAEIYAGKPVWGSSQSLQPRDGMLLLVLMQQTNPSTGRIYLSVSELARQVAKPLSNVQLSIARLKKARLLVNTRDQETQQLYMLLNPMLVSVGSGKGGGKRQKAYQNFYAVLEREAVAA